MITAQRSSSAILAVILAMSAVAAHAQTASQIAPQSYRPQAPVTPHAVSIPEGAGLAPPAGSEALSISLAKVEVEGGFPELVGKADTLVAAFSGKATTVAELYAAARALEKAYFASGYGLVRVSVPPQELKDGGAARLVVVDGYIEQLDLQPLPRNVRHRIGAILQPLVGKRHLKLAELQRRLLLAGQVPGVTLRSTLAAGEATGASLLVIEARYAMVAGQASVDNTLSSALGRAAPVISLSENSLSGHGEQVYISVSGDSRTDQNGFTSPNPRNRALAVGAVIPIGVDGLSGTWEVSESITTPHAQSNGFQNQSVFDRYSAGLTYPVSLTRDQSVTVGVAFDMTNEWLSAHAPVPTPISIDHLRVLHLSLDGYRFTPWNGSISGHAGLEFGVDAMGARTKAEATAAIPLSRQGSDARFSKLDLNLSYSQTLHDHLVFDGTVRAQTGFGHAMSSSEQIGVVSTTGLSGFDSGSLEGDAGYVLRSALSSPWAVNAGRFGYVLAPYGFAACGEIDLERPTAQEHATVTAQSYGVGLRLGAAHGASSQSANVSVELSRGERSDLHGADDRITLTGAVKF